MTPSAAPASRRLTVLAAGLIVLAGVSAYYNSFGGVFIYDDETAIVNNPTIRQLWPVWKVFSPPPEGQTVTGRPLLNLSLAINYAISGLEIWSYHATNLLIHIAAALLLLGILRRTFLLPALCNRFGRAATPLALAGALLWMVHPLQTESVTYIVQRAESLAGFFYLLTLYCTIRGAGSQPRTVPFFAAGNPTLPTTLSSEKGDCPPRRCSWLWYAAAILACLLGVATKEVMVAAPLLVLLYDRTFLAGSFAAAWRNRGGLYLGLTATWALLAYLVLSTGLLGRQSELGAPDVWSYARSQPGVIFHYLRLSVWPDPLCLAYGWPVAETIWEILPGATTVGLLVAATIWGLISRKYWSFLGAWFLLILAPTSSILPLHDLAVEHRMYLPLAAIMVLAVTAGYVFGDRFLPWPAGSKYRATAVRWSVPVVVLVAVSLALGYATVLRNSFYRSALAMYQDAVDNCPHNPVVHSNLGLALFVAGRSDEAAAQFKEALRLKPDLAMAHNNLGVLLSDAGKAAEAIALYTEALRLKPDYAEAHGNLGIALAKLGKTEEAIEHYQEALRLRPDDAATHNNLANVLSRLGRTNEAIEHYQQAVRLKPRFVEAHVNLGNALLAAGKTEEAIEHYQEALRLKPDYAEAHYNLGNALAGSGRTEEAIEHYQEALRLKPSFALAHYSLAGAMDTMHRTKEAVEHYREFLKQVPDSREALNNLAWLLATHEPVEGGDAARAVKLAQRARELAGQENAQCLDTLAAAYAAAGRFGDAVITAEHALRLADSSGQVLARKIRLRLELYRAGRPYREGPPAPPAR